MRARLAECPCATHFEAPPTRQLITSAIARSGGEIAIQFLNAPPPRELAAIVSGTGAYRGARGEAVIVGSPYQTGRVTFSLAR